MSNQPRIRSTTIVAVRRDGRAAMAGDGQVSLGQTILKDRAKKVRRIADGKVVVAFALLERLEA
jgi:ATP-dependent HslUV protease subunit HslV